MVKVIVKKFVAPKTGSRGEAVTQKRVRDAASGRMLTIRTVSAQSKTLGQDLDYVFSRNVAKARRENKGRYRRRRPCPHKGLSNPSF